MSILCRFGFHAAIPSRLWNDGHYFSECRRCGTPMVRSASEEWHAVPRSLQVVWRERTPDDVVWPSHML